MQYHTCRASSLESNSTLSRTPYVTHVVYTIQYCSTTPHISTVTDLVMRLSVAHFGHMMNVVLSCVLGIIGFCPSPPFENGRVRKEVGRTVYSPHPLLHTSHVLSGCSVSTDTQKDRHTAKSHVETERHVQMGYQHSSTHL